MKVREITLREIQIPLVTPFETSVERTEVRRIVLVEADVDGAIGWGECVAAETPSYSPETVDTAWLILRDFLWPRLKGRLRKRKKIMRLMSVVCVERKMILFRYRHVLELPRRS